MAPGPDEDHQRSPKDPDKSDKGAQGPEEATASSNEVTTGVPTAQAQQGSVSNLNDGQLKALLDEAYSYKRPKDRVGKSDIFNELLKTVETTEEDNNDNTFLIESRIFGPKRRSAGRREKGGSERQSHCRSLQNINQCHQGDPPPRRHGTHQFRRGASTSSTCSSVMSESVSTRQREGGSLPCSVNEMHHNFRTEEDFGKSSQRASLEELDLVGMQHSRRESKEHRRMASSPPGTEMTTFEPREDKMHAEALEMEMQMVSVNAAKHTETYPEPSSSYKTFATVSVTEPEEVDKTILLRSPDAFELGLQSETASVTSILYDKPPISTPTPAILKPQPKPATKLPPNYKMDENENMPGSNTETSNSRKAKKSKKKQDNVVPSEKIEGYVGNKHLAYLLEYIGEQATNKGSKVVLTNDLKHKEPRLGDLNVSRRNQRYSEDGKREQQQKQSAKVGRKGAGEGGQNKIKRANSLEEVSKSKLEDITIPPYCRSIGGEDRTSEANKDLDDEEEFNRMMDEQNGNSSVKSEDSQGNLIYSDSNPLSNEDSFEFQTVTNSKKQRRRKQKDQSNSHSYIRGGGGMGCEEDSHQHHLSHHQHGGGRRKLKSTCSVPPSDQSGGDSSDDCDSVHSMPASSHLPMTPAASLVPDPSATKSYAAIARNPPPPPTPVVAATAAAAAAEESWPQVAEETSSSVSSITTEPNTPPEETTVNVLHDYYPSIAESVKGGSRKASEEPPALAPTSLPQPKVPNGDAKRQASLPPKTVPASPTPVKAKSATPPAVSCPPKQQQQRTLQNQPPVIFDEKTQCSDSVEGLTFGFSVNASLMDELGPLPTPPPPSQLDCAPVISTPHPLPLAKQKAASPRLATAAAAPEGADAAAMVVASHLSDVPTSKKTKDFAAMFRPPPQPLAFSQPALNHNYRQMVDVIGNSWLDTEDDLCTAGSNNRSISWFHP